MVWYKLICVRNVVCSLSFHHLLTAGSRELPCWQRPCPSDEHFYNLTEYACLGFFVTPATHGDVTHGITAITIKFCIRKYGCLDCCTQKESFYFLNTFPFHLVDWHLILFQFKYMAYFQYTLWEETNMQLGTNNLNKFTLKAKLAAYALVSLTFMFPCPSSLCVGNTLGNTCVFNFVTVLCCIITSNSPWILQWQI